MASKIYLAVDIGASSGRHVLGWVEDGKIQTLEVHRFANRLIRKGGHLCWDIDALYDQVVEGLRRCAAKGKIPDSLGIDAWAVDYCLLDAQGNRIGDAISYRDGRTAGIQRRVFERVPAAQLYARTGIQQMEINTICQLAAVQEQESGLLAQASRLLMIPDYLHYRLTGVMKQEYTNASTTQLVGACSRDWDWEIVDAMGLPRRLFGPLGQPGETVGPLRGELSRELGFDCMVVLPATHDTASAVAAAPIEDRSKAIFLSSGTWSLISMERVAPDCGERSRAFNFTNEGGVDGTWRYLKNIMGLWMLQSVRHELGDRYSFEQLSALARQSRIDSAVDAQDPRLLAPESMIGVLRDMCAESGQKVPHSPGELARVIAQSLAAGYQAAVAELEETIGHAVDCLHIVGGGSRDDFLNALTARTTGKRIYAGPAEATALGNLLVQMLREGEFPDWQAARAAVGRSIEIRPVVE